MVPCGPIGERQMARTREKIAKYPDTSPRMIDCASKLQKTKVPPGALDLRKRGRTPPSSGDPAMLTNAFRFGADRRQSERQTGCVTRRDTSSSSTRQGHYRRAVRSSIEYHLLRDATGACIADANFERHDLGEGQKAMIVVSRFPDPQKGGRARKNMIETIGFSARWHRERTMTYRLIDAAMGAGSLLTKVSNVPARGTANPTQTLLPIGSEILSRDSPGAQLCLARRWAVAEGKTKKTRRIRRVFPGTAERGPRGFHARQPASLEPIGSTFPVRSRRSIKARFLAESQL